MLGMRALRLLSLAFVAVLAIYSGVWMYYIRLQDSAIARGFEYAYRPSAHAVEVLSVRAGGPAAQVGLRAGDRIVAIDGVPVDRFRVFLDVFGQRPGGAALSLDLTGAGGARRVSFPLVTVREDLSRTSKRDDFSLGWLGTALSGYPLIFLAVASVVLLQRPGDRAAWVMALAFGGLIAGAPLLLFEPQMPPPLRRFMVPVWAFLISTMATALFYFFSVFPAPSPIDRRAPWLKRVLGFAALTVGSLLAIACLISGDSGGLAWVRERLLPRPAVTWVVSSYSIGCMVLALASLVGNAFGDLETRRKTRVILAGTVCGFGPLAVLQAVLASSGRAPDEVIPFWGWAVAVLAISLVPLSVAYAVVKHRVMELPVLLRRSARYVLVWRGAVTLAVLLGILMTFGFGAVLRRLFADAGEHLQRIAFLGGVLFGGLLGLVGQRLWRPAADRIDRAFFRGAYDARRILEQLARDCHVATDRETLAHGLETALEEALQPKALHVYLRAPQVPSQLVAAGADAEALAGMPLSLASPGLAEIARRGQPRVMEPEDLQPGGPFAECAMLAPDLLVPMLGRSGELEGLLVLATRMSEESYSSEDRALVGSAAAQAALALENIRLAETMAAQLDAERRRARELEIAKAVQAKLLPQDTPHLPTLEYAGRCIQARSIGGDYFDFITVDEGRLALVLADISGKGLSAALLMASLQAGLRAQYTSAPSDLPAVLRTVNRVFCGSTATNHYATLFFAVYDERTRRLQYANCGHLPPIIRRSGGAIERLDPTATVVGMFDAWECGTGETALGAGDTLVVFSDGAPDALDAAGEEFGDERLVTLVDAHPHASAPALLETMVATITAYSGPEQYDDLTLLVARGR